MKLSLSWIFDHLEADWRSFDINTLVARLNSSSAEIEGWHHLSFDSEQFFVGRVHAIDHEIKVEVPGYPHLILPPRAGVHKEQCYLLIRRSQSWDWARLTDLGGQKEGELPALLCPTDLQTGGWRAAFEWEDYILEVDNKSITHRPDMWSHRGFAREIAALFDLKLKNQDEFITDVSVYETGMHFKGHTVHPLSITIEDAKDCSRFAALSFSHVTLQPSLLWMVNRLVKTDNRPLNAIVDITNYVMLDMGHPMHAFDSDHIAGHTLTVRKAHAQEKLTLLDGQVITLTPADVVVADARGAISLAGVMGGESSAVSDKTKNIVFEAACFDAATIRRSAFRHKKRTEASARFEKTLDGNQNIIALQRCVQLLKEAGIPGEIGTEIVSLGKKTVPRTLSLSHSLIEHRLGVTLTRDFVVRALEKLEMKAQIADGNTYVVTVPTFRATKDIMIPEDIIEEVGRLFGYYNIPRVLPARAIKPTDISTIKRVRALKNICAQTLGMRELYTYSLFDEQYLEHLKWQPEYTVSVQSPVSQNWRRLVTTLIPNLLHAVQHNATMYDSLAFFEWGRVWSRVTLSPENPRDQKKLALIWYAKKGLDFYTAKANLNLFFASLNIPVTYADPCCFDDPWKTPFQTADIRYGQEKIGELFVVPAEWGARVAEGTIVAAELDGDFLEQYDAHKEQGNRFKMPSKYPDVVRDVSMFVPLALTVDQLKQAMMYTDTRIDRITTQDFFEKPEWQDKRAVTLRYVLVDYEKTMTGEEVDQIHTRIVERLKELGASIR